MRGIDINTIKYRKEPVKHSKIKKESNTNNVVNSNKVKLYEYYSCDYCGDEIRLDIKQSERSGGIVIFPHSLTKCGEIKLALCNKCLKEVLKQFEEFKIK